MSVSVDADAATPPSISNVEEHTVGVGISHLCRQRTSSFGLTKGIIEQFSPDLILEGNTSALPGGSQPIPNATFVDSNQINFQEIVQVDLPTRAEMDFLLDTYLNAVHWFMMMFHEPTFRRRYDALLSTGNCDISTQRFAIFVLLILSIGARYANREEARWKCPGLDLEKFQQQALAKVEESLLGLFDELELESVQICVLLGSFYLYHGRPNRAFVVLGAGIRCAQAMSLHRESAWPIGSEMNKEERRRVWWALFVFDRYVKVPRVDGADSMQVCIHSLWQTLWHP